MRISAVEALRESLPTLFGSQLKRIVPERGDESPEVVGSDRVNVYIKPETEVVAWMGITALGGDEPRHYDLVLSEATQVQVAPNKEQPESITVINPYDRNRRRAVTIFKGGVSSQEIDIRV